MNEVEFAQWVDDLDAVLAERADPPHLMIAYGVNEREADLATAELERRGHGLKVFPGVRSTLS